MLLLSLTHLAQGGSKKALQDNQGSILLWSGLLLVVLFVLWITIQSLRRRLGEDDKSTLSPFTLHDLRQMHAAGQLTDEEFEKARDAMVRKAKARLGDDKAPAEPADAASGFRLLPEGAELPDDDAPGDGGPAEDVGDPEADNGGENPGPKPPEG